MAARELRFAIVGSILVGLMACPGVGPGKNIDFGILRSADRIEVRTADDRNVATVTSRVAIDRALSFIESHHDGWREPWYGPHVPRLMFYFFEHDRKLGGFGLDRQTLVVDPTMRTGWLSRDISNDEVDRFLQEVGVNWPK